jgi:hypothetical protein
MTQDAVDLKLLQEFLYRLITAPNGVVEGLARDALLPVGGLESLVACDDRMTPVERVEIYANSYFYRLLEVLKEDFPATLAVAGADHFHNLVTGYLADYPPVAPSIFFAGQNFAAFLATQPPRERWPFLASLALLERTALESFHAADAHALDADAMRTIAPADWPALTMCTHPATRLVDCAWRVDKLLHAFETGATWQAPDLEDVTIIVWRRDARVSYRILETVERGALRMASVAGGTTFAAICEAIAAAANETDDVAPLINRLLTRWLLDGLLIPTA